MYSYKFPASSACAGCGFFFFSTFTVSGRISACFFTESDDAIGDMFIEKIAQEWQLPMITAGVTSNLLCLFPSRAEVTDYSLNLADMNGAYNFVGLYTKGEYDENGYLKCYYWEAGVL
jgi:hypothetical protein